MKSFNIKMGNFVANSVNINKYVSIWTSGYLHTVCHTHEKGSTLASEL